MEIHRSWPGLLQRLEAVPVPRLRGVEAPNPRVQGKWIELGCAKKEEDSSRLQVVGCVKEVSFRKLIIRSCDCIDLRSVPA